MPDCIHIMYVDSAGNEMLRYRVISPILHNHRGLCMVRALHSKPVERRATRLRKRSPVRDSINHQSLEAITTGTKQPPLLPLSAAASIRLFSRESHDLNQEVSHKRS